MAHRRRRARRWRGFRRRRARRAPWPWSAFSATAFASLVLLTIAGSRRGAQRAGRGVGGALRHRLWLVAPAEAAVVAVVAAVAGYTVRALFPGLFAGGADGLRERRLAHAAADGPVQARPSRGAGSAPCAVSTTPGATTAPWDRARLARGAAGATARARSPSPNRPGTNSMHIDITGPDGDPATSRRYRSSSRWRCTASADHTGRWPPRRPWSLHAGGHRRPVHPRRLVIDVVVVVDAFNEVAPDVRRTRSRIGVGEPRRIITACLPSSDEELFAAWTPPSPRSRPCRSSVAAYRAGVPGLDAAATCSTTRATSTAGRRDRHHPARTAT